MIYFPQLETGAVCQYPLVRVRRSRTLENRMGGGESIRFADASAQLTEWRLAFSELTDSEAGTLQQFFEAVEGQLETFTFLDPAGNLLAWSGKLDEAVWEKGPLVSLTGGVADPFGGTGAWRISGAEGTGMAQTLAAPGWFYYCLSLWARCDQESSVTLVRGSQRSEQRVGRQWQRLSFPSCDTGSAEQVRFGVEPGGGAVEVFGLQVEAQPAASGYKATASRGGVYRNARLADDRLVMTAAGPGRYYCELRVLHGERF